MENNSIKKASVLVPCYNEDSSLPELLEALTTLMQQNQQYSWEIILVDDGSKDGTLEIIKKQNSLDVRFGFISFSRNFGKEAAILAGLDYAKGDCAIIIDADLQHPPSVIPVMLKEWENGYEDIYAKRTDRGKEPWLRRKMTMLYYHLLQNMSNIDILPNVGDFRLLDRKCIDAIKQLRETQRYTKGMYCWIGFKKKEILFEQGDRQKGSSSFNFWRLLKLSIEGITSYTTSPLRISTILGLFASLLSFGYMLYIIFKTFFYGEPVSGFPTIMAVMLFLGGAQLLSLGIIGEYLGRIFHETKKRPVYLVSEHEPAKSLEK